MQAFLPYPNFADSVRCLDRQRLGKQRIEARQLHDCLRGVASLGWRRHPAVRMWRGYADALAVYGIITCLEWRDRGYLDNQLPLFQAALTRPVWEVDYPPWLGDERFHASHRSNLLRKDLTYYGRYGWSEPHDLPYAWPDTRAYLAEAILCS